MIYIETEIDKEEEQDVTENPIARRRIVYINQRVSETIVYILDI